MVLSLVALAAVAVAASCGSEGSTDGQVLGPAVGDATATSQTDDGKKDDHGRKDDDRKGDGKRSRTFRARLCGYEETPAISTSGSGRFRVSIGEDGTLTFKLTYRDLVSPVTVAHIHFGQPGVAGGVSAFLCGGGGKPACPQPPATVEGTIVAADVVGPANQGIAAGELDELLHALRNGLTYANVHSEMFPAGEVRGQIVGHHRDHHGKRGHGHARGGDRCHQCLPCRNVKPPDGADDGDMDGGGGDDHDHDGGDGEPTET